LDENVLLVTPASESMMIVWYVYGGVDHALGADSWNAKRIAVKLYAGATCADIAFLLTLH